MKALDIIQTAQSNLRRSKVRTFLTILAVFIGTFTLTMTTAITQGVRDYINVQIHAYGESNSFYVRGNGKSEGAPTLTEADVNTIKGIKNVATAYPDYAVNIDSLQYKNAKSSDGISSLYPDSTPPLSAGKITSPFDPSSIILPYDALSTFGFATPQDAIGKTIVLNLSTAPQKGLAKTQISKSENLIVAGVLTNSIHGQPAFISYNLAGELYAFQNGSSATFSSIYGTEVNNLSSSGETDMKNSITQKGYQVMTFADIISRLNQVITLGQLGTAAFAGIALLVACICIINTLFMAVLERTQEIGLLKALGMRRIGIFAIFAIEAASIGFWGGVLGVGLGLLLDPILNRIINHLVANLGGISLLSYPPVIMISIILGGMIIGLLAGIIPALRASRMDPIVALRHE